MAKSEMSFPAELLVPKGGEIYCHVFENAQAGIARSLFWSITVEFERLQYGNEEFDCSLACEWVPWLIRNWRELDHRHLEVEYGENGIESSFYMCEHDSAKRTKLSLFHRRENVFRVSVEMLVDFSGFYGGDEDPALPLRVEADVAFIGLLIIPRNLSPEPSTIAEIRGVASAFVDLSAYREPEPWQNGGFILRPALE